VVTAELSTVTIYDKTMNCVRPTHSELDSNLYMTYSGKQLGAVSLGGLSPLNHKYSIPFLRWFLSQIALTLQIYCTESRVQNIINLEITYITPYFELDNS
jgi:hypothetical protein